MALTDNLVSFWKLGEASGDRADSIGANPLTPTNTPGNAAGIIGNAVQLVAASSQRLSIVDASQTGLDPGTSDFALSAWFYLDSTAAIRTLICKGATAGGVGQDGFFLYVDTGPTLRCQFSDGSAGRVLASKTGVSTGAWQHVVVNFNRAGNSVIYLNDVAGTGANISAQNGDCNSSVAFTLGSTPAGGSYFDGRMDAVGVWSRVLTSGEITSLYNAGAGWEPSSTVLVPKRRQMVIGL